jgi:hypothetical protein
MHTIRLEHSGAETLFFALVSKNAFVVLNRMKNVRVIRSAAILQNITELSKLHLACLGLIVFPVRIVVLESAAHLLELFSEYCR